MLPEAEKLMKRAFRASKSVQWGPQILDYLKSQDARDLLIEGANEGIPPVSKVAVNLLTQFGPSIKQMPVKTFIGLSVRAILAEENYQLIERGVRTDRDEDPVFRTGAIYKAADEEEDDDESEIDDGSDPVLVELLVRTAERLLNDDDRRQVIIRLKDSL